MKFPPYPLPSLMNENGRKAFDFFVRTYTKRMPPYPSPPPVL